MCFQNIFYGKTVPSALESLNKRFGIRRVIIVSDKGIAFKVNLKDITDKGHSYKFAYRLKSAPYKIKNEVLKGSNTEIENEFDLFIMISYCFIFFC